MEIVLFNALYEISWVSQSAIPTMKCEVKQPLSLFSPICLFQTDVKCVNTILSGRRTTRKAMSTSKGKMFAQISVS